MARTSKGFCAGSRANPGQNKDNTGISEGQKKINKEKDLRKAATEGKCNFTNYLLLIRHAYFTKNYQPKFKKH